MSPVEGSEIFVETTTTKRSTTDLWKVCDGCELDRAQQFCDLLVGDGHPTGLYNPWILNPG